MNNNGINPANLSDSQYAAFLAQPPSVQQNVIRAMAQSQGSLKSRDTSSSNGTFGDQGSPMTGAGMEMGDPNTFFANNAAAAMQMRGSMPPQGGQAANGPGGSNHALQDYQMQLMLLEQQNKKRLLMAKQEHETAPGRDSQPAPFPGGMSPSGSRGGPSPQPDQIRRGTPKLGNPGVPGSPMPDGRMTGSPGPMNLQVR